MQMISGEYSHSVCEVNAPKSYDFQSLFWHYSRLGEHIFSAEYSDDQFPVLVRHSSSCAHPYIDTREHYIYTSHT